MIKNKSIHFILLNIIFLHIVFLTACASITNTSASQVSEVIAVTAPDLQKLSEISSVKNYPLPPENLPGIPYSMSLSENPHPSDLKKISVVSTHVNKWKPQESVTDVNIYDKSAGKYVACVKNCYRQSVWQEPWGQMGKVWSLWAKDDAVYLISPSEYALITNDGLEYINGYLGETDFYNVRLSLEDLGWQPEGETTDFYLYSKKDRKFVAYVKDCWRQSFCGGIYGWGGNVKNAYRIITTDGKQYLVESFDYTICNEDGYEYKNGWLVETDFEKLYRSCGALGWQPQGEICDYYLYSKKQKKIVTCLKDCWRRSFCGGIYGWSDNVKNAYRFITTDGKEYLAESSEYIIQEKIDDLLVDAYSPDIKVTVSSDKLEAGKKITVSASGVKNKYLLIYGVSKDKKNYSLLKTLEGGENRKASFIVPFSSDKIQITFSNQTSNWVGTCYESDLISKPVKNGRIFQIPASYEKANKYRKSKPDESLKELANAPELEELRLSNPDAYLDEVLKRINKMGLDNYGKVTAIHDFIAYLVCYDHDAVYEKYMVTDKNGAVRIEERAKEKSEAKTNYKDVVLLRKTSCSGYSALFYEMCCRTDIVCEIVSGYARGYLWKPDDDVNKTNHAWNAVMLDGVWYLIDNTWDAGSESDGARRVSCGHTWLFVPPEEFMPTHLPLNSELQMMKKPVSAGDFKNTAFSRPRL